MIRVDDYDFDLPEELIAQTPLKERDKSRLMVVDKKGSEPKDYVFSDLVDLLDEGDILVFNDSRVIPARLFGHRKDKEEKVEFLLLKELGDDRWQCLSKPGKKAKVGTEFFFGDELSLVVDEVDEEGLRYVTLKYDGILYEILDRLGTMPLPPYIHEKLEDQEMYQTVYAKDPGSAAAPTAGLHFTDELLEKLKNKGIEELFITLNVGLGTFRPVTSEFIEDHKMHEELYTVSEEVAAKINAAKKAGKKVVAVGTTTIRTLESAADENGEVRAGSRWTNIFIYPGYKFKVVDKLITNFHLPKSTLLMLISAVMGRENALHAYKIAVDRKYSFFSFGDAMFIE